VLIRTQERGRPHRADACARSLSLGAEVVVLDAGSKDDTAAIAARFGARVYRESLAGIRPQRHFGEEKCSP
jgi:glycosyltransferase involved in cell wall biosynthesis